jgi:hypothetical protein
VPAYPDEDGVDPTRNTETYAEVTLEIETARWRGTPFILRGGKALRRRRKGVRLRFRSSGHEVVNELWIGIDGPSDIRLRLAGGAFGTPAHVDLRGEPPVAALPPHARVLFDVLTGGCAFSVRAAEAEEAWRVVTPCSTLGVRIACPSRSTRRAPTGRPRRVLSARPSHASFSLRLVYDEGRAMRLVRDTLADAPERAQPVGAAGSDDHQINGARAFNECRDGVCFGPRVNTVAPRRVPFDRFAAGRGDRFDRGTVGVR